MSYIAPLVGPVDPSKEVMLYTGHYILINVLRDSLFVLSVICMYFFLVGVKYAKIRFEPILLK